MPALHPIPLTPRDRSPLRPRRILPAAALWAAVPLFLSALAASAAEIHFNRDVRPILSDLCFQCHGPDSSSRKAEMRFDREEAFFAARDNGTPVVPGRLDESLLWQRISSSDPDEVMPPPESHKQLTAEQRDTLRKWIEEGARWQPFWALIQPSRPPVPAVRHAGWVRNPIDAFILERLEQAGLEPAPEADRRSLGRRASLDATGLPPDPQAIERFAADSSPAAYEQFLERLIHSPAYGEHRARFWLDAARYADTHGLHFDNYREMWPYRDWVIQAYNANLPFDQFTLEQLAGDLLPEPGLEQLVATGFHRCCMTTNEGGTIPEENAVSYARDRVETTGAVWLGLTLNCATCHDH